MAESMKSCVNFILAFVIYGNLGAQGQIQAKLINFNNDKGVCRACLFDNASAFEKRGNPLICQTSLITNHEAKIYFADIKQGWYAILVFHDENNNGILDKNFLGIPIEGYGASNNRLPFTSAPGFKKNKFYLNDKQTQGMIISIRNIF
ncbi:MAG: hypothetical protein NVS9B7_17910 [Flavisolibacter sp.]